MTASAWSPNSAIIPQANANGTLKDELILATQDQRVFSLTKFAYSPNTGSLFVFKNGQITARGVDYVELDGTTVLFLTPTNANDKIQITGFVGVVGSAVTDAILRADLFANAGANNVNAIYADAYAVARSMLSTYKDTVNVKGFGAKGDGVTNDTVAIQKADLYAASVGAELVFPAGTYMTDAQTATASWRGDGNVLIKYRGVANVDLVTATGRDGITFTNLEFDGSVSADPGVWSAANYDSFIGATGLTVSNCDSAKIIRCRAKNTRQHGFRLTYTTNALIEGCRTKRSRGNFGDGFIAVSTIGTTIRNCYAYDFTRIGFVFDTFGTDMKTSHNILFEGCTAEYGHDCSKLYTGGEYNAGAWAEHCAHVQVDNFTAKNMSAGFSRGLVLCSGVKNNGVVGDTATFNVSNVMFENTGLGLNAYSLSGYPVAVNVDNLKAYKVYSGVSFVANAATDYFQCSSSFVDIDFLLNPNVTCAYSYGVAAGLAGKPTISFVDCGLVHTNEDVSKLTAYGTTTSVADVGAYIGDPANNGAAISVTNMSNSGGNPVWINVPYLHAHMLTITNTYTRMPYAGDLTANGAVVFRDCRIHSAVVGSNSADKVEFYNCKIEGQVNAGGKNVRVDGCRVTLTGADFLWLFSTSTGKRPGVVVTGTLFDKDVAAGNKVLRLGFGATTFTAILSDLQVYNSSGTVTANPMVTYATNCNLIFSAVYKDSTITNIYDLDTGGNLGTAYAGVTNATFH